MSEKDLTSDLLLRLRKVPKTWWYKIPDPSRCPGCGMISVASKRPFDVVGMSNGVPIALEIKKSAGIPLQAHQLAQLRLVTMAGGLGFKLEKNRFFVVDPEGGMEYVTDSLHELFRFINMK